VNKEKSFVVEATPGEKTSALQIGHGCRFSGVDPISSDEILNYLLYVSEYLGPSPCLRYSIFDSIRVARRPGCLSSGFCIDSVFGLRDSTGIPFATIPDLGTKKGIFVPVVSNLYLPFSSWTSF